MATLLLAMAVSGCGRKGDPIPRPRAAPAPCEARWTGLRVLEVRLPTKDVKGADLVGVDCVQVYYLPLGVGRPEAAELLKRGELVWERRRQDLPDPGRSFRISLADVGRPAGWILVVAVRVGHSVGEPGPVLPWLDPAL